MNKTNGVWGVVAGAALLAMAGCQCAPPVGECGDMPKAACPYTTTTVIHRCGECGPALPPVGEITVTRNDCLRTKMVFVAVRPDDRCYNVESRNFERPWPWGPYGMGNSCP